VENFSGSSAPSLRLQRVQNRQDMDRFIRVPWSIYAHDPNWIAPLIMERRDHLNPKKNPFFDHAETAFWLVLKGDKAVGRISAQVDHMALEKHQDAAGFFGFLEAEDNEEVFRALLEQAEGWLTERGMKTIRGPFSLSINDEAGLLIDGFDTPPSLMMGHGFPYYATRMEALGYGKAQDMIAYDFQFSTDGLPKKSRALVNRLMARPNVTVRNLRKDKFLEDVTIVLDIFNDGWADNWGFVPLTAAEIEKTVKDLKLLIQPKFVRIIEVDGEPAAFALTLPNLNEAIADLNGRLLPFGWAKLLYRLKFNRIKTLRLPMLGIRKKFHNSWLAAAMALVLIDTLHQENKKSGMKSGELSWVLDDNVGMRRIIESTGCRVYKTYRVYEKNLSHDPHSPEKQHPPSR